MTKGNYTFLLRLFVFAEGADDLGGKLIALQPSENELL